MIRILSDIAFLAFAVFYLPFFCVRLKQAESKRRLLCDRFGFLPRELCENGTSPRIWIHAVSVGEVLTVRKLVDELRTRHPGGSVFLSVVTPTGFSVARKALHPSVCIFYLPFDVSVITAHVVAQISPTVLVLAETEIWPNLIFAARTKNVPVCIVNGRFSPKSFRGYYRFKALMTPITEQISCAAVQTERYRQRFVRLGFSKERVVVTGTMKFDVLMDKVESVSSCDVASLKAACGFPVHALVFIAASTHDPEEEYCLDAYCDARKSYPRLRLIIAPRHVERARKICECIEKKGLKYQLAQPIEGCVSSTSPDVYVLNTVGQLAKTYAYCDIVFVGGSLVKHGGQNPLEAAIYKLPIITGPIYHNFTEIYTDLLEDDAVVVATGPEELSSLVRTLCGDEARREDMGAKAYGLIHKKTGATKKNADIVDSLIMQGSL